MGGCRSLHPAPLFVSAGGEREARGARQGRCSREGRRGRDAWEDGMMLLTPSHPSRSPAMLSLWCLQLRLRAVPPVPGYARTFRPCGSQGRARGRWSPRAGGCKAASAAHSRGRVRGSIPLKPCSPAPSLPCAPGHCWPSRCQRREGKEPEREAEGTPTAGCCPQGGQGSTAALAAAVGTPEQPCVAAGRAGAAGGCAAGRACELAHQPHHPPTAPPCQLGGEPVPWLPPPLTLLSPW